MRTISTALLSLVFCLSASSQEPENIVGKIAGFVPPTAKTKDKVNKIGWIKLDVDKMNVLVLHLSEDAKATDNEGRELALHDLRTGLQATVWYDKKSKQVIKLVMKMVVRELPQSFKVGDIGELRQKSTLFTPRIVTIIGPQKMQVELGLMGYFILEGFPTNSLADNQRVSIHGECECTGTEKIGVQTLRVLRPINDKTILKVAK